MNKVYDPTVPSERRRFVAGTISMNGMAGCPITPIQWLISNSAASIPYGRVFLPYLLFIDAFEKISMVALLSYVWHFTDRMNSTERLRPFRSSSNFSAVFVYSHVSRGFGLIGFILVPGTCSAEVQLYLVLEQHTEIPRCDTLVSAVPLP